MVQTSTVTGLTVRKSRDPPHPTATTTHFSYSKFNYAHTHHAARRSKKNAYACRSLSLSPTRWASVVQTAPPPLFTAHTHTHTHRCSRAQNYTMFNLDTGRRARCRCRRGRRCDTTDTHSINTHTKGVGIIPSPAKMLHIGLLLLLFQLGARMRGWARVCVCVCNHCLRGNCHRDEKHALYNSKSYLSSTEYCYL